MASQKPVQSFENIFDHDQSRVVKALAEGLKSLIKPPEWAGFVKTGVHKERPPENPDWWFLRAGSVLRKVYLLGPIGVSKLRRFYGGRKNRGVKPEHFFKGSGKIVRTILQQFESLGFVEQTVKAGHKGRVVTKKGEAFIQECLKRLKNN